MYDVLKMALALCIGRILYDAYIRIYDQIRWRLYELSNGDDEDDWDDEY